MNESSARLTDALFITGIILIILLFEGKPCLMDAILYNLTNGAIPIPSP